MIRYLKISIVAICILILGAIAMFYTSTPQQQQRGGRFRAGAEGPVPVLVAAARKQDMPVYLDGVGTSKALNTVVVRSQVDGKLVSVNFKEGQDVEKGFVLARIDPATYQAQYDQAVAKKAQDEAQLANARIDLERYQRLAATNAGSKQQADTQAAAVAQLEAQVKLDQAAINNAKAILDYTSIVAPISGRTGIRQVDEGNIVSTSDTGGIVTITQIKPISVIFSMPQQDVFRINAAFAKGSLMVEALAPDNRTVTDRGALQVVDNQVDPTTGTVKLKAEFPNSDLQLWPGQFVNVRLVIDTLRDAVVVPTAAVQRGPNGTFVYVIDGENAKIRNVHVAQQDDMQAVIASGLEGNERVVTSGFTRLSDGAQITVGQPNENVPIGVERQPLRPEAPQSRRRNGEGARTEGTSNTRP
ncbi:MAG TPA: efflux RND transporter periplasmic adaptor subunit [Pseudorhodoplanes sp.]|jgi:multidrug efflux system membrane fusion protein|nr:efflux RND transporter periplasmic adaptor subunit [Pseudorhodoplanes sp.]